MKIAFVMLSHRPPDSVFRRLLGRVREIPDAQIGLHHDFGQSVLPDGFATDFGIRLVEDWMPTQWGHATKVPATLKVFRLLYESTDAEWFVTLSPNCYPVQATGKIVDVFEGSQADVHMQFHRVTRDAPPGMLRNKYRFLFTRPVGRVPCITRSGRFYLREVRVPLRRENTPFREMDPFQGSDWFALRRNVVGRMLAARLDKGPVLKYLAQINEHPRTTVSPIEMVIQTFVGNQQGISIEPKNHRFIDWENAKNYHPNTLTMRHWEAIRDSDALFARKFVAGESDELLDRIDRELLGL